MQDPNADTEWNDLLRKYDIISPKKVEIEEEHPPKSLDRDDILNGLSIGDVVKCVEKAEDDVDEEELRFLEEYRRKRMAALIQEASRAKFGDVREVTKADWKVEITEVKDAHVVVHIASKGHPLCSIVDQHLKQLAQSFPTVKFLRGEYSLCIPGYPESNLPSLLIYHNGDLQNQLIGPISLGDGSITVKGLEWRLAQLNVVKSDLTEDPSKRIRITRRDGNYVTNRINHEDSSD